jgi:hypothetical protein
LYSDVNGRLTFKKERSECVYKWLKQNIWGVGGYKACGTRQTDEKLMQFCSLENLMDIYTGGKLS